MACQDNVACTGMASLADLFYLLSPLFDFGSFCFFWSLSVKLWKEMKLEILIVAVTENTELMNYYIVLNSSCCNVHSDQS